MILWCMNFRVKRQFQPGFGGQGIGGPGFGQGFPNQFKPPSYDNSQSTAQSNSHSNYFGPNGSQNADALAAAQGNFKIQIISLLE